MANKKINLRRLEFNPFINPLVNEGSLKIDKKKVFTATSKTLTDLETGEILGTAAFSVTEIDKKEFVKIFAMHKIEKEKLTAAGRRVLEEVLQVYIGEPMRNGYSETVYIYFYENENKECFLNGNKIGLSLKTLQRGLKELIENGWISPKSPNVFWINPHLYFKGDRLLFLKEYRLKKKSEEAVA